MDQVFLENGVFSRGNKLDNRKRNSIMVHNLWTTCTILSAKQHVKRSILIHYYIDMAR